MTTVVFSLIAFFSHQNIYFGTQSSFSIKKNQSFLHHNCGAKEALILPYYITTPLLSKTDIILFSSKQTLQLYSIKFFIVNIIIFRYNFLFNQAYKKININQWNYYNHFKAVFKNKVHLKNHPDNYYARTNVLE